MRYAVSWSGGKDSMLALDRALAAGLDVALLFTIHDAETGRLRFHGVRWELIEAQAESLGIELLARPTRPEEYEAAFEGVLATLVERGIGGVVFGNIHLEEIRAWYEARTRARGLDHREPLWGGEPGALVAEFLERGEYHTFVFDGPRPARPIAHRAGPTTEREGHRFVDLIPV